MPGERVVQFRPEFALEFAAVRAGHIDGKTALSVMTALDPDKDLDAAAAAVTEGYGVDRQAALFGRHLVADLGYGLERNCHIPSVS